MLKKEDKKSKDAQRGSVVPELQNELQDLAKRSHSVLHVPTDGDWSKADCCGGVMYIVLCTLVFILALVEIVFTATGAVLERFYDAPQTARLVAMIMLTVVTVVTIGIIIYAMVGVARKHTKPIHTASIVLLILVVIQAIIAGTSVYVREGDELKISRFLTESYYRAKDGEPSQIQLWDSMQSKMQCCGIHSPEDYKDPYAPLNFPPDIPASCCPLHNSQNTTTAKVREMCKANNSYFKEGCKILLLNTVKATSISVIAVTVTLIIIELILAILGIILSKKRKEEKREHIDCTPKVSVYPANEQTKA